MSRRLLSLASLALLAGCDRAEAPAPAPTATPAAMTSAQKAYADAAARMHGAMAAVDPDPDVAFARGMIPHHQGAIDMARVELAHGKDPAMRALAQEVIAAQEREIAGMKAWLAKRGAGPAAAGAHAGH
jgi:uncharacterized protein (DUF305 family)